YPDSPPELPVHEVAAGEFLSTLLDIINPLQHIPLVSNLYREITGDEIEPAARVVGGAVFGGPLGFASATANVVLEQASGRDMMGHAVDMVTGGGDRNLLEAGEPTPDQMISTAEAATSDPGMGDIVWSGPRVVPSLARADYTTEKQGVTEALASSRVNTTKEYGQPTTDDPTTAVDDAAEAVAAGANTARPAWMAEAIEVAQQIEAARASGTQAPDPLRTSTPWMANAMLEALDKYEAMARDRSDRADEPDHGRERPDRS
ncbi:MAG: hypothetical protein JJ899_14285, partial [Alphaproteobacteria bacterium]|nr:hypothetical protein [Alphaproteobacteria bacterium]